VKDDDDDYDDDINVSCCFISINNKLLVLKCYLSLMVSGFSRNKFNSYNLFNFYC
jgi:hypothetical protein